MAIQSHSVAIRGVFSRHTHLDARIELELALRRSRVDCQRLVLAAKRCLELCMQHARGPAHKLELLPRRWCATRPGGRLETRAQRADELGA